jgi:predicted N-acetyltransferase YhbS
MTAVPANGSIRRLTPGDIPAGLRLSRAANWNQTAADWQRLLTWEPDGCFVLDVAGQTVGTVTTTCYGTALAWVGMVLVDADWRRQGFGRRLLLHALDRLAQRGVGTVMLDATPEGRQLYERLGFRDVAALDRWQGNASGPAMPSPGVRPLSSGGLSPALLALDRRATGVDRRHILQGLQAAAQAQGFYAGNDEHVGGFVLLRPGERRWHVGPLVATTVDDARALLRTALAILSGQPVEVDVPRTLPTQALVQQAGLAAVRPFVRMLRGDPQPAADLTLLYAGAGPEIG